MMHAAKDSIDLGIICGDIHASLHFYRTFRTPLEPLDSILVIF
jgi:hypothetical protein